MFFVNRKSSCIISTREGTLWLFHHWWWAFR